MNHMVFQIALFAALIVFTFYIFRLRTPLTDRIIFLALVVVGAVLVANPDLSTEIAHRLEIGRGTDLIFYVFIIASLFFAVTVTTRQRQMQRQITLLVRQMALDHPLQSAPKRLANEPDSGEGGQASSGDFSSSEHS